MRQGFLVVGLLGLTWLSAASAESLTLSYSGTFGPTSSLGGVEFGAPTKITFIAEFDPAVDLDPTIGAGMYNAVVTVSIDGYGTFQSLAGADLKVIFSDPRLGLPIYGAGISTSPINSMTAGLATFYYLSSVPFDADAPVATTFSVVEHAGAVVPFVIPLAGGAGDLVIRDLYGVADSSSVFAVPEPSSHLTGALALAAWVAAWAARRSIRVGK